MLSFEEKCEGLPNFINQLQRSQNLLIILHYYDNLSMEDISKIMEKPIEIIESLHKCSLSTLKKLIEDEDIHEFIKSIIDKNKENGH